MNNHAFNRFGQALLLAALLAISLGSLAGQPYKLPNHWIVELTDAPTLAYEGENVSLEGAGLGAAKRFEATAPSVTGQDRFDASRPAVQAYAAFLDQRREQVLSAAAVQLGLDIAPTHVYRHTINGFAVRMSAEDVALLGKLSGVKAVHPVALHHPETDATPGMINAPTVWNGLSGFDSARGEGVVIGVIDSGINWDSNFFAADGGVNGHEFTNPYGQQLGLCSNPAVQCSDKLVGVYDFTTEGSDGFDLGGHGTHVASIAAGVPINLSLGGIIGSFSTSGVAPHANIVSYKVCYESLPDDPDESGCPGSAIVAGLEQALDDGVDVVNYSLGGGGTSPWTQATGLLNFWTAGIPFVTSAGNSGPGFESISSPANAPWVFAIGSSTHDRWVGHIAEMSIGSIKVPFILYGSGPSLASTLSQRPMVDVGDIAADRLACSPLPAGSLSNSVAVIQRGTCAFETKVNHAADAGAVAVLVFNNQPGLPIIMGGLDGTTIPAAMMTLEDGLETVNAMANFSDPVVTLTPSNRVQSRPDFADVVSSFSSRGPGPGAPNVMKPNALAPGGQFLGGETLAAGILGAGVPDANSLAAMQGTSMAAPAVAGAVALLRQLHPNWTPPMLQSTLETTAEYEPVTWQGVPANLLERGAGRIRVDHAARAGLYLPVSRSEFEQANPAFGGNPGDLNLAGIFRETCVNTCTTTRTVEALQNGSWEVTVSGDIDINVSPTSFSLQAGQQQALEISFGAVDQSQPGLLEGRVHLTPTGSAMVEQTVPIGFQAVETLLPEEMLIEAEANRGSTVLEIPAASFLSEAVYNTSPLVRPTLHEFALEQDPTWNDPFDGEGGTKTFLVDVPDDTLILYAETVFSTAPDIDLFVGRDINDNGQADEEELVCFSVTVDELEECLIKNPESGTWWILVQNWQASSSGADDDVELEVAMLTADANDYSLVASGPGLHMSGALDLDLYWDQPAMRQDERWFGAVGISSSPDALSDQGVVPVVVVRTGDNTPQATSLFNEQELAVVIPPQTSHERLFIDLPPNAEQLRVSVEGDEGVSGEIRSVGFDELAGWAPDTPPPGSAVYASGSGSADGFELVVGEADPPAPARYYIVLENNSSDERLVHVRAELIESGFVDPVFPGWSPQSRDIFQGIEWRRAGDRFLVWYTYDEDGLPSFYNAVSSNDAESSVWRATLFRTTSNDERQTPNAVGEVAVTAIDDETLSFAWRLNGAHGSEIMTADFPLTCPQVDGQQLAVTGHWFDPSAAAGGTTMAVTLQGGAFVRYYFDGQGIGRWVIVPTTGSFEDLEVLDFRGFCPNCPEQEMTVEDNSSVVGLYSVNFDSDDSATETLDMVTDEPLNDDITLDASIIRISDESECWPFLADEG